MKSVSLPASSYPAMAAVLALALLVDCGHGSSRGAGGTGSQSSGRDARSGAHSSEAIDPNMVSAVSSAHSTTPISMKYLLSARPVVGSETQVTVALIPASDAGVTHIHASFQPGDGLQLPGEHTIDIDEPSAGVAIEQQLPVLPQQTGVLSLNATVMVDMNGTSLARSYTIPLIVSDSAGPARSP